MRRSDRGRRLAAGAGVFLATACTVYGLVAAAEVAGAARRTEPSAAVVQVEAGDREAGR